MKPELEPNVLTEYSISSSGERTATSEVLVYKIVH